MSTTPPRTPHLVVVRNVKIGDEPAITRDLERALESPEFRDAIADQIQRIPRAELGRVKYSRRRTDPPVDHAGEQLEHERRRERTACVICLLLGFIAGCVMTYIAGL
jgi:hypothetical protein